MAVFPKLETIEETETYKLSKKTFHGTVSYKVTDWTKPLTEDDFAEAKEADKVINWEKRGEDKFRSTYFDTLEDAKAYADGIKEEEEEETVDAIAEKIETYAELTEDEEKALDCFLAETEHEEDAYDWETDTVWREWTTPSGKSLYIGVCLEARLIARKTPTGFVMVDDGNAPADDGDKALVFYDVRFAFGDDAEMHVAFPASVKRVLFRHTGAHEMGRFFRGDIDAKVKEYCNEIISL